LERGRFGTSLLGFFAEHAMNREALPLYLKDQTTSLGTSLTVAPGSCAVKVSSCVHNDTARKFSILAHPETETMKGTILPSLCLHQLKDGSGLKLGTSR
jgi:hypothetical protein